MQKIRTIIIDDEKSALEVLQIQLTQYCTNIDLLELCNGGEQGIKAIKKHKPDLVFLDIEMPFKNGFDVLLETKELNYKVIFTTAYNQFAIKAFKFSAVDYLLKPIDIQELKDAVQKIELLTTPDLDKKLETLFKQFQPQLHSQKIALPIGDTIQFFHASEIIRCESDSNYTHIFIENGKKITTAKTLKDVEHSLHNFNFCRVHQSHLINMDCIDKIVKGDGGYIMMTDGAQISISRNKKEEFMDRLNKI